MGVARISCASGCACEPVLADAHVPAERVSVPEFVAFNVSQSPVCELLVEVVAGPSSRAKRVRRAEGVAKGQGVNPGGVSAEGQEGQAAEEGSGERGNKWKLLGLDVRATEPTALPRSDPVAADAAAAAGDEA